VCTDATTRLLQPVRERHRAMAEHVRARDVKNGRPEVPDVALHRRWNHHRELVFRPTRDRQRRDVDDLAHRRQAGLSTVGE
jgi:hypothetical protein